MGEGELAPVTAVKALAGACRETIETMDETVAAGMQVQAPGGVFTVRGDTRGSATALGQLAFSAE